VWDKACHSMSLLPVNGNHEGFFGWTEGEDPYEIIRQGKIRYLPFPDQNTFPEGGDADGRYGAFTWGDVLFVWLDVLGFCEADPLLEQNNAFYILGDTQQAFLEQTLANSTATWKFVFAHHLFGGDDTCSPNHLGYGRGNASVAYQYQQATIQNLMVQHGVQAFFYGHDHVFSVSEAGGVAYICTGHAASNSPWADVLKSCYQPYVLFTEDAQGEVPPGHVRVDVDSVHSEVRVEYILSSKDSNNGTVLDTYIIYP